MCNTAHAPCVFAYHKHRTLFGTDTPRQCLEIILNEGEVNLTAAERKEKVDKKKREMGMCSLHFISFSLPLFFVSSYSSLLLFLHGICAFISFPLLHATSLAALPTQATTSDMPSDIREQIFCRPEEWPSTPGHARGASASGIERTS